MACAKTAEYKNNNLNLLWIVIKSSILKSFIKIWSPLPMLIILEPKAKGKSAIFIPLNFFLTFINYRFFCIDLNKYKFMVITKVFDTSL